MFKEEDFKIYKSITKKYITRNIYDELDNSSKYMLDIREVLNEIKSNVRLIESNRDIALYKARYPRSF